MSGVLTRVVSPGGSSWAYLDAVGRVTGLTYDWTYPGGPTACRFGIDAPATAQIPALRVGSTLTLHRGGSIVWAGRVGDVDRDGWRVDVDGLAGLATREPVAVTGNLDAIVDNAITDGLPWTRPAALTSNSWSGGDGGQAVAETTLDQVLTDTLLSAGKRWTVATTGSVSAVTDPTTPALIVRADTVPPLTLNDYATHVTARYRPAGGTYATVRVRNDAAAAKFGRVNRSLDLGYNVSTSAQAAAVAQAYLDRVSPRMTVAGDFTVTAGQITTETGAPADLAHVRPGVIARIQLVSLVRDALLVPTTSVDMLIGATSYDVDADKLTLSPTGRALNPLQEMFTGHYRFRAKVTDA